MVKCAHTGLLTLQLRPSANKMMMQTVYDLAQPHSRTRLPPCVHYNPQFRRIIAIFNQHQARPSYLDMVWLWSIVPLDNPVASKLLWTIAPLWTSTRLFSGLLQDVLEEHQDDAGWVEQFTIAAAKWPVCSAHHQCSTCLIQLVRKLYNLRIHTCHIHPEDNATVNNRWAVNKTLLKVYDIQVKMDNKRMRWEKLRYEHTNKDILVVI